MMDEPTSALTAAEIPVLFQVIRDLASHGVAIVYISHRLEELLRDRGHRHGAARRRVVGEAAPSDVDYAWIVERMTGRSTTAPARIGHGEQRRRVLLAA